MFFQLRCVRRWESGNGSLPDLLTAMTPRPQNMNNKGFGHLETRLFTIKTSKNVGLKFGDWEAHGVMES